MQERKIETTIGMCVVALTKYIMSTAGMDHEAAYKALLATELYELLQDADTRLFLETNEYLQAAYDRECTSGKDALYEFINQD